MVLANVLGFQPKSIGQGVVRFARDFRQPITAITNFAKITLPNWGRKISHTVTTVKREMQQPVAQGKQRVEKKESSPSSSNHEVSEKDRQKLRDLLPEK